MSPKSPINFAANQLEILKHDHDVLVEENFNLKNQIRASKINRFSYDSIRHSNESVKLHTGFPSAKIFEFVFESIEPKCEDMQYFKGKNSFDVKIYQTSECIKPGPARVLKPVDEMLLTLMKLRLNLLHEDLAERFKISQRLVSCILSTWIPFLGFELKSFIRWPSMENIENHYPSCFRAIKV